ncbi:MAG TPA: hypothetical protein VGL61_29430 [Kofleriaceae bacterium]
MFPSPAMPEFPPGQSTVNRAYLRFEDVAMDGRMMPISMPPMMSGLWREVLVDHRGASNALKQGILPILTRLVMTSSGAAIRIDREVETRCGFELARDPATSKLFMNVWAATRGAAGKLSRAAASAGELVDAGSLFAEHTFTRVLAPPGQRAVTELEVEGYPRIPETSYAAAPPTSAEDAPPGARWLDELAPDDADHVFTLDQSDSNQHVNSLVYVRVFLDAVYRRLAARGHVGKLRSTAIDIAYRKPCFPGDRVRTRLRLYEHDGALGLAGQIAGTDDDKPRCHVRVAIGR